MANQSPFQDLLAGLQSQALPDDPDDDLLFRGSLRDDARAPSRFPRGTQPPPNLFAMPVPPPAPLPSPHHVVALPLADQNQSTIRVGKASAWRTNKKLFAASIGLSVIVVGALAAYLTSGPTTPVNVSASSAVDTKVAAAPMLDTARPAPLAPSVTPANEATAAGGAMVAAAASAALPKDAVAPPTVVPASQFDPTHQPTLPTVADAKAVAASETPDDANDGTAAAAKAPAKQGKASSSKRRAAQRESKRSRQRETRKVARAERAVKSEAADLGGNGALSVSSSKPREVWVDGRNSKRMTPLRVLLKPGKHKVTLFDKANGSAKTFDVEIKPNVTTKVSK